MSVLSENEFSELWKLFQTFFVNEYDHFDHFRSDLIKKDVILMFENFNHSLIGFTILVTYPIELDGKKIIIIDGKFIGCKSEYRNLSITIKSLLLYCFKVKLKNMRYDVYYWFLTYSYRSYVSFGRTVKEYWPRHTDAVPEGVVKIFDVLGHKSAEGWGTYIDDRYVIMHNDDADRATLGVSLTNPNFNMTIAFFFERNANFRQGDCLCVLSPISWLNVFKSMQKVISRTFKRRKGRNAHKPVAIGSSHKDIEEISQSKDFKVEISQSALEEIDDRISHTNISQLVLKKEDNVIKEILEHWNEYNWSKRESKMNQYPQYTVDIEETKLHFIHVLSRRANPIPLILIHGFLSTPYEFLDLIPHLTSPLIGEQSYHVICPSLPGHGWSDKSGVFTGPYIAELLGKLMISIGYDHFIVHGTEWGASIAANIASFFPHNCIGVHAVIAKEEWSYVPGYNSNQSEFMKYISKSDTFKWALSDSILQTIVFIVTSYRLMNGNNLSMLPSFDFIYDTILIFWYRKSLLFSTKVFMSTVVNGKYDIPSKAKALCSLSFRKNSSMIPISDELFPKLLTASEDNFSVFPSLDSPELLSNSISHYQNRNIVNFI